MFGESKFIMLGKMDNGMQGFQELQEQIFLKLDGHKYEVGLPLLASPPMPSLHRLNGGFGHE